MNNHPLNLSIRFLLEVALIIIYFYWGWIKYDGILQIIISCCLPIIGIAIWAIFKVNGDPGKAIVAVNGWVRLIIECSFFTLAFFMLRSLELNKVAAIFIAVTTIHYIASYDRIKWLLNL